MKKSFYTAMVFAVMSIMSSVAQVTIGSTDMPPSLIDVESGKEKSIDL